ncbi:MAG: histidinol-phosphate transaminase [Candidatus Paceibacterota bacterium]|jgi:histidinol-phosphate aminotransferase
MINSLVRSNLRNFKPYSSARSLYQKGVFMDANENSLGSVISTEYSSELNRYPDPLSMDLRKALGKFLDISEKNIFVGSGSDEIIDLLIRLFVEQDEEIIVEEPSYGMYKVAAEVAGVKVKSVLLKADFQIDISNLLSQITFKTKIIFLCSPNNPTGALISFEDIENICKNFKGIVVVDEAYVEFSSKPSLVNKVSSIENLVVLRTFSKAWGLAGIRVGYAVAQEEIIDYLNKIKLPYNLNRISSKLAIEALGEYQKMLELREIILGEREKLANDLIDLDFKVFPSEANFLLVNYPNASEVAKTLALEYGIIIRDFGSKPMLKDCVRISVGSSEQNDLLIKSLKKIL